MVVLPFKTNLELQKLEFAYILVVYRQLKFRELVLETEASQRIETRSAIAQKTILLSLSRLYLTITYSPKIAYCKHALKLEIDVLRVSIEVGMLKC